MKPQPLLSTKKIDFFVSSTMLLLCPMPLSPLSLFLSLSLISPKRLEIFAWNLGSFKKIFLKTFSSLKSEVSVVWKISVEWYSMMTHECQILLIFFLTFCFYLPIYLIYCLILHSINCFSFSFSCINISVFYKKI